MIRRLFLLVVLAASLTAGVSFAQQRSVALPFQAYAKATVTSSPICPPQSLGKGVALAVFNGLSTTNHPERAIQLAALDALGNVIAPPVAEEILLTGSSGNIDMVVYPGINAVTNRRVSDALASLSGACFVVQTWEAGVTSTSAEQFAVTASFIP